MELTIDDLIEYHRRQAQECKAVAVGWGGAAPGTFVQRQNYRFHCDAVDKLEEVKAAIKRVLDLAQQTQREKEAK